MERIGADSLSVDRPVAATKSQAWRETDVHLRIWEVMHPEVRVMQSAS